MTSTSIVASVRAFLSEHAPFSRMAAADVEFVARNVELAYFAGGEVVLAPSSGAPEACLIVRQGLVEGLRPRLAGAPAASDDAVIHLTPGEPFPVGALLAGRPVSATYRASGDVFCWRLERVHFVKCDIEGHELAAFGGSRDLVDRDRPTIICECEERHAHDSSQGVGGLVRLFEPLGYRIRLFYRHQLIDVDRFDPKVHQVVDSPDYGNNWLLEPKTPRA